MPDDQRADDEAATVQTAADLLTDLLEMVASGELVADSGQARRLVRRIEGAIAALRVIEHE